MKNEISGNILNAFNRHILFLILFLSTVTLLFILPSLNKYILFIFSFISLLYCAYILFGDSKGIRHALLLMPVIAVIFFYCFISLSSFYPKNFIPSKNTSVTLYSGKNYYNFLAASFKSGKLFMPIEPSEKLKSLNNPYDSQELNKNLDFKRFDYIIDLSYFKEKYYLYFGITPVIMLYLPFQIITKHFLSDSSVTLFFGILSFCMSLIILKKIILKINKNENKFLIEILSIMAAGLSSVVCYLITLSRVYEVAIIGGLFFALLSFLFVILYIDSLNVKGQNIALFIAGLSIALAVGCRPFYAFAIFIQLYILYKFIKKDFKKYIYYFFPIIIYAIILMAYNYLRFNSIFEFGGKYQLSVIEIYNWKISLKETFSSIMKFIYYPPVYLSGFPYFSINYVIVRGKILEQVIGLLFTAPFLIVSMAVFWFCRDKSISIWHKKYIVGFFVIGIFILVVVSTFGSIYRYAADFSTYFIIPAVVMIFYLDSILKKNWKKILFQYMIMSLLLISIIFNCALVVSSSINIMETNNPYILYKLSKLL
ncbi:MAG: hypothetical protein LBD46_01740 [Endomicrobium sp.]|nr:hypothetical protein [Endomicrobium sp.]